MLICIYSPLFASQPTSFDEISSVSVKQNQKIVFSVRSFIKNLLKFKIVCDFYYKPYLGWRIKTSFLSSASMSLSPQPHKVSAKNLFSSAWMLLLLSTLLL